MAAAPYLIRNKLGIFQFRRFVPADLIPVLGKSEIRRSSKTRCVRLSLSAGCTVLPRGGLSLAYDRSWLDFSSRRPVSLSLPLADREYAGSVVENYFDNLLPDSHSLRKRL